MNAALNILTPEPTARVGKIARLPRRLREQLNLRLDDGEMGIALVEWLNALPEVNEMLKAQFEGRAINAQNLSDWRQGGFRDWCQARAAWDRAALALEEAEDFQQLTGRGRGLIADKLNVMAVAALGELLREAMAMEAGPEKRRLVLDTVRELGRLRRAEHARAKAEKLESRESEKSETGETENGKQAVRASTPAVAHTAPSVSKEGAEKNRKHYVYEDIRKTVNMLKSRGKPVPAHLEAFLAECAAAGLQR